jgi:hypothetical protein
LTEEYDFEAYNATHTGHVVHLFAIDEQGQLQLFSSRVELAPVKGWKVVSLISPDTPD